MAHIKGEFQDLGPHDGMGNPHKDGSYALVRLVQNVGIGEMGQDVQMLVPRHQVENVTDLKEK